MEKEKIRFWSRLVMVPVFLLVFWQLGVPAEALIVLAAVLLVFVLLRGKMWKAADRAVERWLPFTRKWPEWGRKVAAVIVFIIALAVLKQAVYFLLSLAGIDMQKIIVDSLNAANTAKP